jgi:hypothetical protein
MRKRLKYFTYFIRTFNDRDIFPGNKWTNDKKSTPVYKTIAIFLILPELI